MRRIFNWLPVILMTYVTTRECVVILHQPKYPLELQEDID